MGEAIIVGAGIGGLTAALALQRAGVGVRVLERAERLVPAGAGLTIQPNAVMALRRLGIGSTFETKAQPLSTAQILTAQGKLLQGSGPGRRDPVAQRRGRAGLWHPPGDPANDSAGRAGAGHGRAVNGSRGRRRCGRPRHPGRRRAARGCDRDRRRWPELDHPNPAGGRRPAPLLGVLLLARRDPRAPFPPDWSGEFWGRGTRFGGCGIDGGWFYWFAVADARRGPGIRRGRAPRRWMPWTASTSASSSPSPPRLPRTSSAPTSPTAIRWRAGASSGRRCWATPPTR